MSALTQYPETHAERWIHRLSKANSGKLKELAEWSAVNDVVVDNNDTVIIQHLASWHAGNQLTVGYSFNQPGDPYTGKTFHYNSGILSHDAGPTSGNPVEAFAIHDYKGLTWDDTYGVFTSEFQYYLNRVMFSFRDNMATIDWRYCIPFIPEIMFLKNVGGTISWHGFSVLGPEPNVRIGAPFPTSWGYEYHDMTGLGNRFAIDRGGTNYTFKNARLPFYTLDGTTSLNGTTITWSDAQSFAQMTRQNNPMNIFFFTTNWDDVIGWVPFMRRVSPVYEADSSGVREYDTNGSMIIS
jgi:hypothetical protein